jgi:hypothetical protein
MVMQEDGKIVHVDANTIEIPEDILAQIQEG